MTATRSAKLPALQTLVLGCLITGTILVSIVAAGNFAILDAERLPRAAERLHAAGADNVRFALRHGAGELNRFYFLLWNRVQLGLVLLFLVFEWLRSRGKRMLRLWVGVAVLVLAAAMLFYFTPWIIETGRSIDFVPAEPITPERAAFRTMHGIYMALDGVKLLLAAFLVALTFRD
ncbi:MAG: hypothetical protein HYR85_23305 [Planctomycetes bacterium]|nr:hypothetical protein [Planctomycetota bacterium]